MRIANENNISRWLKEWVWILPKRSPCCRGSRTPSSNYGLFRLCIHQEYILSMYCAKGLGKQAGFGEDTAKSKLAQGVGLDQGVGLHCSARSEGQMRSTSRVATSFC